MAPAKDLAGREYWDGRYRRSSSGSSMRWVPASYEDQCIARMLEEAIKASAAGEVLEVGCGDSRWLPFLARREGIRVTGMDYSERGCVLARERLCAEGLEGDVVLADFREPGPEQVGRYAMVYSLGVAEHFDDTVGTIASLAHLLCPGGVLLTEVPNLASVHGLLSLAYQPKLLSAHRVLTRGEVERAYREAGLEDVRTGLSGLCSIDIVAWGVFPRFPGLDRIILPVVARVRARLDRVLCRSGSFRGLPGLAPFLYALGRKPAGRNA